MNNWKLLLLSVPLAVACGDKSIDDTTEPSTEASSEPSGEDTSVEEAVPLVPAAIGFEYSGLWDAGANDGDGGLSAYLFPDLNNTNEGAPLILSDGVTVTITSAAYFSSDLTDEEKELEQCTVFAWFDSTPANLLVDDYDWENYAAGLETYTAETWQSFEGILVFNLDSASDRCAELDEGYSLDTFDGMHFGLSFGGLSDHMTAELESSDWWADDAEAQNSYFTQYISINHPNEDGGYKFIGYDWTSSIFVAADSEECAELEGTDADGNPVSEEYCGLVETEEVDGGASYVFGDVYDVVNPQYGYVQGSAWWYEDFPNLDLDIMKDFNR